MTLKKRLDKIWNDSRVRCPSHKVWWVNDSPGLENWGYFEPEIGWYRRGTIYRGVGNKKKGYSFLPKNYGFYWHTKVSK